MLLKTDDLSSSQVQSLILHHVTDLQSKGPPETGYALDLSQLRQSSITFYTAWEGDDLLGCGALKEIDPRHGEIKSMRTVREHTRKGVARALVQHIIAVARSREYTHLSLETGSSTDFLAAQRLYGSFGFGLCQPFGDYVAVAGDDSIFMTLSLE